MSRKLCRCLYCAALSLAGFSFATAGNLDWVVFNSDFDGTSRIWKMRQDGSSQTRITTAGTQSAACVSPYGDKVAYIQNQQIWVINFDGTNAHQVTSEPFYAQEP